MWLVCLHYGSRLFSGKQIVETEHNSKPNWDTSGDTPAVLAFVPPYFSYSKYLEKGIFHTHLQNSTELFQDEPPVTAAAFAKVQFNKKTAALF